MRRLVAVSLLTVCGVGRDLAAGIGGSADDRYTWPAAPSPFSPGCGGGSPLSVRP